ncbi:MAG: hypothetical protein U0271_34450 [Polyangiaceae bacterium]
MRRPRDWPRAVQAVQSPPVAYGGSKYTNASSREAGNNEHAVAASAATSTLSGSASAEARSLVER